MLSAKSSKYPMVQPNSVIFGYLERLDGDLMGPTDRRVAQSLKQGNPVMTQETEEVL
jgi:hypothetical protein